MPMGGVITALSPSPRPGSALTAPSTSSVPDALWGLATRFCWRAREPPFWELTSSHCYGWSWMLLDSTLSGHLTPGLGLALELELALEVLIWLEPVCLQQVCYTLLGVVPTGKGS